MDRFRKRITPLVRWKYLPSHRRNNFHHDTIRPIMADKACHPSLPYELLSIIFAFLHEQQRRQIPPYERTRYYIYSTYVTVTYDEPFPKTRFDHVCSVQQPTLAAAAQVCRGWRFAAEEQLYGDVLLTDPRAITELHRTLKNNEEFRKRVRSVMYIPPAHEESPERNRDALYKIYALCPCISPCRVQINRDTEEPFRHLLFRTETEDISIPQHSPSPQDFAATLTFLEIRVSKNHCRYLDQILPSCSFPVLLELELWNCRMYLKPNYSADERHPLVGWPSMPSLRRLRVSGCGLLDLSEASLPLLPLVHTLEVTDCTLIFNQCFLDKIVSAFPNVELLSLLPDALSDRLARNFQHYRFNFAYFRRLAHLRISTSILWPVHKVFDYPQFLQILEIVENGGNIPLLPEAVQFLKEITSGKTTLADLSRVHVVVKTEYLYRACVDLKQKASIDVRFVISHKANLAKHSSGHSLTRRVWCQIR